MAAKEQDELTEQERLALAAEIPVEANASGKNFEQDWMSEGDTRALALLKGEIKLVPCERFMKRPPSKVAFTQSAYTEFNAARDWYEGQRKGLGGYFALQMIETLTQVKAAPQAGAKFGKYHRRVAVSQFPYRLIYMLFEGHVAVSALEHAHKMPVSWRQIGKRSF